MASSAEGAFAPLAQRDFFARVAPRYADRIFAFNHLTLSHTVAENAQALLKDVPRGVTTFDVIAHSRGGLLLRHVAERRPALRVERGVLVAVPNQGTPLASAVRWETAVGWIANLLRWFPDNPLTFGAALVSETIVWLARRVVGSLPGLAVMDPASSAFAALESSKRPLPDYSALVANHVWGDEMLRRVLDAGVDGFFSGANDLVVPTEGGWRAQIPGSRIACFGPGGNLDPSGRAQHLNLLSQDASVDLLVRGLEGRGTGLPPIDVTRALPDRRLLRTRRGTSRSREHPQTSQSGAVETRAEQLERVDGFHITVLPRSAPRGDAQVLAEYRGARVLEPFPVREGIAGQRWREIIQGHEAILRHTSGRSAKPLAAGSALAAYGATLFAALFPGDIRRLYDVARSSLAPGERLVLTFTSMIPWVAEKPWELSFDTSRQTFLATQDVDFIRNVLTSIPAEFSRPRAAKLRLLVVVAQPIGAAALSASDETALIRRGFAPLVDHGLASVDVVAHATPNTLHDALMSETYDVLHFIGHGDFDEGSGQGALLFEAEGGKAQRLGERPLRELLCRRGIRLVFLNACETGRGGRADFNRGVAPALVAAGLPAVIANQYAVLDASATAFARRLYWGLGQGNDLASAVCEARVATGYADGAESIDFAVPVVYARDPHLRLVRPRDSSRSRAFASTTRRSARAIRDHAVRVAVWDSGHSTPGLEECLNRLNSAQTRFGFQLVQFTMPLGVWRARKGSALSLLVPALSARLAESCERLGFGRAVCLTQRPFAGAGVPPDAYAWWPDAPAGPLVAPVTIVSMTGVQSSARRQRAVANALALAVLTPRAPLHHAGSTRCPLHSSADIGVMGGRQRFDEACAKRLGAETPDAFAAAQALLRVFD
jgi:hypothetical protein